MRIEGNDASTNQNKKMKIKLQNLAANYLSAIVSLDNARKFNSRAYGSLLPESKPAGMIEEMETLRGNVDAAENSLIEAIGEATEKHRASTVTKWIGDAARYDAISIHLS